MDDQKKKKSNLKISARYMGMAAEMFGLLILMVFAGRWIDDQMQNEKNYVTAILVILGMSGYFYRLYLQLTKNKDK